MIHKKTAIGFPLEKDFPRQVKWYHKGRNYASKNGHLPIPSLRLIKKRRAANFESLRLTAFYQRLNLESYATLLEII